MDIMNFSSGLIRKLLGHRPEYTLEELTANEEFGTSVVSEADTNFQLINFLSRKDNFDKIAECFLSFNDNREGGPECLHELADKVMMSSEKKYLERISKRKDLLMHIFSPLLNKIGTNESPKSVQRLLKVALNYSRTMIFVAIPLLMPSAKDHVDTENYVDNDNETADNKENDCNSTNNEENCKEIENDVIGDSTIIEADKSTDSDDGNGDNNKEEEKANFVESFVHNFCIYPNEFSEFFNNFVNILIDNRIMYPELISSFLNYLISDDILGVVANRFLGLSEDSSENGDLIEQMANFAIDIVSGLKRISVNNETLGANFGGDLTGKLLSYALEPAHNSSQKSLFCFKIVCCLLPDSGIKETPSVILVSLPFVRQFAGVICGSCCETALSDSSETAENADNRMVVENNTNATLNLTQGPVEPFGTFRLEALGVVERMFVSDCEGMWEAVAQSDVILGALIDVFYKYPWNTFLHTTAYNIFKAIISSSKPEAEPIKEALFCKYGFLERLAASEETGNENVRFDYFAFNTRLFVLVKDSESKLIKDAFNETFTKDDNHSVALSALKKRSEEESLSLNKVRQKNITKSFDDFISFFNRGGIHCLAGDDIIDDDDDDDDDYVQPGSGKAPSYLEIDMFNVLDDDDDDEIYTIKENPGEEDKKDGVDDGGDENEMSEKIRLSGNENDIGGDDNTDVGANENKDDGINDDYVVYNANENVGGDNVDSNTSVDVDENRDGGIINDGIFNDEDDDIAIIPPEKKLKL